MQWWWNKANLMEFDSCDRPSNLSQLGVKSSINHCMWPWNLMNDLKNTIRHLVDTTSSFVHHFKSIAEFKLESQSGNAQFGSKFAGFFVPRDLEIWWMTLKYNGAPLLYYIKFVLHFKATGIFKLELQSGNAQFGSKLAIFVLCDPEI